MQNVVFSYNLSDLNAIQKANFYQFLLENLKAELNKISNPIFTRITIPTKNKYITETKDQFLGVYLYMDTTHFYIKGPLLNTYAALLSNIDYSIDFYINIEFWLPITKNFFSNKFKKVKNVRIKRKQKICTIPLMTEDGTFIINGCERIIINQLVRSPGVYFKKEYNSQNEATYCAILISNSNLWTKFYLDKISLVNKKNPIDFYYVELINEKFEKTNFIKADVLSEDIDKNSKKFANKLHISNLFTIFGYTMDDLKNTLNNHEIFSENSLFFSNYNQEHLEKILFNKANGLFILGKQGRYNLNKKLGLKIPPVIEKITLLDIIKILDRLTLFRLNKVEEDDIDHLRNKRFRSVGDLISNEFQNDFINIQETTTIDLKNDKVDKLDIFKFDKLIFFPELLTKKIEKLFTINPLSQFLDQINPLSEITHKRRVSLFGENGISKENVSLKIRDIHPSQFGRLCPIETPEGQNAGLIMSLSILSRVNKLQALETPFYEITKKRIQIWKNPIYLDSNEEREPLIGLFDAELNCNNHYTLERKYMSVKKDAIFSRADTDEMNYLYTLPNQFNSIATSLIPFIEHDDANRALMGSNMQRQAVPLLFPEKPLIGTGFEVCVAYDSQFVIKSYSEGIVVKSTIDEIQINDHLGQIIKYFPIKLLKTNQNLAYFQQPCVWTGEAIYSGQIIADGPSTVDGELALGTNLLVGYMPWEGYNFEDAIVINERLVFEDRLTSLHIHEYEFEVNNFIDSKEILSNEFDGIINSTLDHNGIIKQGSYIKNGDVILGKKKQRVTELSWEEKLFDAVYNVTRTNYIDTSILSETNGRVVDIRIIETEPSEELYNKIYIYIYIAEIRKIEVGDKLSGRHGNKGVISKLVASANMPFLPDGTPLDILLNPLGVPSRMNVGQLFEALLGFSAEYLGVRYKIFPFDEIYQKEASRILINQKLTQAKLQTKKPWLFSSDTPGKIFLRDGRTGEYFDNPILVGRSYILKLIHLVEEKLHARSQGPYTDISQQPLAGKSEKGGQRFGEMEVWALEAYGSTSILQELFTVKSDDIDGRLDVYLSYGVELHNTKFKPIPNMPESFLLLSRELNALGLDFQYKKVNLNFYNNRHSDETDYELFLKLEDRIVVRKYFE